MSRSHEPPAKAPSPAEPPPEFSRVVRADSVHDREVVQVIEANEAERRALAERLELEAIHRLTATIRMVRVRDGQMVRVLGQLEADVVQTCVVTLEPVDSHVSDSFGALFAPDSLLPTEEEEMQLILDPDVAEEDIPEPMPGGRIDIGELTAQHLSLALDPYPRAPGAELPEAEDTVEEEEEPARPNPFAALERLKRSH